MTQSTTRAEMRTDLKKAAQLGRHGDDRLVHVNSYEEAVLRGIGGAGTVNPRTGLKEYYEPEGLGRDEGGRNYGGGSGSHSGGSGQGGAGGGSFGTPGRLSGAPPHAGAGGGQTAGLGNAGGAGGHGGGPGNDTTATQKRAEQAGVSPTDYADEAADYRDRLSDSLDSDNSFIDNLGNMLAGFLGFNETPPDELGFDPVHPKGPRSDWGWDAAGPIGTALGAAFGAPFLGTIADAASAALGRPLSINAGPDVFQANDPVTGEPIPGNTTHSGGNVTVHDSSDPNTFVGLSPGLGNLAGGAAPTLPTKKTFSGADPDLPDLAPETPYQPVTPAPSPIDTPPNNIQVDVGNSQLSPSELTNLFAGFMQPGRTARGRNPVSVIV